MRRRRLLTGVGVGLGLTTVGCLGGSDNDTETADEPTPSNVAGRIDPTGHVRAADPPFYTFGHISRDGVWGLLGSFPTAESDVASTLVDLSTLEEPVVAHEVGADTPGTRTNDVKFDALRDGLYYRSQEHEREGIEVVDFGYETGSPDDPAVVASLETPNTGVHKLTTHPTEPVLYLVDLEPGTDVGIFIVDVSSPDSPEIVDDIGPRGGCHDVEYDPVREVLHAAYILGEAEGYVIYDAEDPYALRETGHFEYAEQPDYTTLEGPGFELCHQADYDPERDLAVIGDEVREGVPGGKHVFDLGWDEGSLEDPQPIGFSRSPDARRMGEGEPYWWTTHFHDVVPMPEETLVVDGGYRQGSWVCNVTDPTEPTPTERFATVENATEVSGDGTNPLNVASPPFAWSAVYNDTREVVFVSDSISGAYTFELSAADARGDDGGGPDGHYDLDAVLEDDPDAVADGNHGL